jgi:hypothetical protein
MEGWSRGGRKVVLTNESVNRVHPMSFGLASFRGHIRTNTLLWAPGDQEQTAFPIDSTKKNPLTLSRRTNPVQPIDVFKLRTPTVRTSPCFCVKPGHSPNSFYYVPHLFYSMCLLSAISYDLRRW